MQLKTATRKHWMIWQKPLTISSNEVHMKKKKAVFCALLAAALYAINSPLSKLLLNKLSPTLMAALLYLGAGIGVSILSIIRKQSSREEHLTKKELPFTISMVILDIAAPIFLMLGLNQTSSANASLLNNFEITATAIIALVLFKEYISRRLWIAIGFVTVACIVLSFEGVGSFQFSIGSLFVLLATICWGFENNCTRMLSHKDPMQVVIIKGFGSGLGSLLISIVMNQFVLDLVPAIFALLLGFVAYGLSIYFYIYAQRDLGAAKTSTYYAISPFIGAILSLLIYQEIPGVSFFIGFIFMIIGTYFAEIPQKKNRLQS
jgi:drug/metabolite transporter (DMT)-like permease